MTTNPTTEGKGTGAYAEVNGVNLYYESQGRASRRGLSFVCFTPGGRSTPWGLVAAEETCGSPWCRRSNYYLLTSSIPMSLSSRAWPMHNARSRVIG